MREASPVTEAGERRSVSGPAIFSICAPSVSVRAMKIEILESREYRGIGAKAAGEVVECDDALGRQLISQNFAKQVGGRKRKAETESTEDA